MLKTRRKLQKVKKHLAGVAKRSNKQRKQDAKIASADALKKQAS